MQLRVAPELRVPDNLPRNPASGAYDKKEWLKAFRSQPKEFDYVVNDVDIDGEIPSDLCGSLFRNRPALFERGRG